MMINAGVEKYVSVDMYYMKGTMVPLVHGVCFKNGIQQGTFSIVYNPCKNMIAPSDMHYDCFV